MENDEFGYHMPTWLPFRVSDRKENGLRELNKKEVDEIKLKQNNHLMTVDEIIMM